MNPVMITPLLADADSWWNALSGFDRFFFLVALVSGIVAATLSIAGLLGLDHGGDGFELDHGDSAGDAEGFSLRAITGFFLGFGWVGFACSQSGYSAIASASAGLVTGLVMMFGIRFAMKSMKRLKSDGTVKYANAVGSAGTAYVTIPPSGATGGQVTVVFDNRSETLPAIQEGAEPIPGGVRVKIVSVNGRTLTVARA